MIVPDGPEPDSIAIAALEMIRQRSEWNEIDAFVFPLSANKTRIQPPVLVKMALSSGRNLYCK